MLGVTVIQQYEKYLGLLSLVGRNKRVSLTLNSKSEKNNNNNKIKIKITRMGSKALISSGMGNIDQSYGPSPTYLYYGMFQASNYSMS